jgi:hypothetical protein
MVKFIIWPEKLRKLLTTFKHGQFILWHMNHNTGEVGDDDVVAPWGPP